MGYLVRQLTAFRMGVRVDEAMQPVSEHPAFNDPANIKTLAAYLSMLNSDPKPVLGSGKHLRLGQESYTHICAGCHGFDGRGEQLNRVPRVAGQHYPYLRHELDVAAELHRALAPPEMINALRGLTDQEKDAIADYVSRLSMSEPLMDLNRPDQPPN